MASYIPNHRKKRERLAKNKEKLRRLIERGANQGKLLKAAMEVRDGRIRALRAKQNRTVATILKDEAKVKALQVRTAESVLAEYLPS